MTTRVGNWGLISLSPQVGGLSDGFPACLDGRFAGSGPVATVGVMSSSDVSGPRDLNGRVVRQGRLARLTARLRGGSSSKPLELADEVVVVAESDDDAVASSTALEGSDWRADDEVILRHDLELPSNRVQEAAELASLDGYMRIHDDRWGPLPDAAVAGHEMLVLARVQTLDALHLSQERSRMASLGSRHGGIARRWSVLQRPAG